MAKDLFKEVVEITQADGPQECEVRIVKISDQVTEAMADNENEWTDTQHIFDEVSDKTLQCLSEAEGFVLSIQQDVLVVPAGSPCQEMTQA